MARAGGFFQRTGLDPKMDPTQRFVTLPGRKKPVRKFTIYLILLGFSVVGAPGLEPGTR